MPTMSHPLAFMRVMDLSGHLFGFRVLFGGVVIRTLLWSHCFLLISTPSHTGAGYWGRRIPAYATPPCSSYFKELLARCQGVHEEVPRPQISSFEERINPSSKLRLPSC